MISGAVSQVEGSSGRLAARSLAFSCLLIVILSGCTDEPHTEIVRSSGPGWELVGYERGDAIARRAAVVTSQWALDLAWEEVGFTTPKPDIAFAIEVGLILTPGVGRSCPDITFDELTIETDDVFGVFDYPRRERPCTSDFTPINFFFVVHRSVLPERFTLAVSEDAGCDTCRLVVDLSKEQDLMAQLWGGPLGAEAEAPKLVQSYGCGFGFAMGNADQTAALVLSLSDYGVAVEGEVQEDYDLPDEAWLAELQFGSDLFANWCDDVIEPGEPEAVIDESVPAKGHLRIDLLPEPGTCGQAKATLTGASYERSDGMIMGLGDFELKNGDFGCLG